jgi:uncharacterized protein (DUF2141 family)
MKARSVLIGAIFVTLAAGSVRAEGLAAPLTDKDCVGRKGDVRLIVQVGALRSNAGEVTITVYPADPERFLAPRGKLLRQRVKTSAPMTQACFNLPVADAYAVEAFHDANADREFDRNTLGMPTEGYAFSNDAPSRYAKPSYDAARFMVKPGDNTIRIKIRYPR